MNDLCIYLRDNGTKERQDEGMTGRRDEGMKG